MKFEKRFPANTTLESLTFLNNKKVDGQLYGLMQSLSEVDKNKKAGDRTFVLKSKMPTQAEMCRKLEIKSAKTYRTKLKELIELGYIIDEQDRYALPDMEEIYFMIPIDTLNFIVDNYKTHVLKLYIYLGQRYKYALSQGRSYEFTLSELGEHIGVNVKDNSRGYEIINNALDALANDRLIEFKNIFDKKFNMKKKLLTNFSFEPKRMSR